MGAGCISTFLFLYCVSGIKQLFYPFIHSFLFYSIWPWCDYGGAGSYPGAALCLLGSPIPFVAAGPINGSSPYSCVVLQHEEEEESSEGAWMPGRFEMISGWLSSGLPLLPARWTTGASLINWAISLRAHLNTSRIIRLTLLSNFCCFVAWCCRYVVDLTCRKKRLYTWNI